jgi:16S rRNA (cytidine1402-2'-O)-methyltransferase
VNNSSNESGVLYVVATPIGHYDDLSQRALRCLGDVSCVLAEDTRRTGLLLKHHGVSASAMRSTHEHNEAARVEFVVQQLAAGHSLALVTDAGTPLVSDPGFQIVRAVQAHGFAVSPLPGACAAIAALCVAGLPSDRFCFEGFLPSREEARRERLRSLCREPRTVMFYESPRRLADTMADIALCLGKERLVTICRELTKTHEQVVHGSAAELCRCIADGKVPERGEVVLVVAGAKAAAGEHEPAEEAALDRWLIALSSALSPADAARIAAKASGRKRSELYKRLLAFDKTR